MEKFQKSDIETEHFKEPYYSGKITKGSKRDALYQKYSEKLSINPSLNRRLVSFQGNKKAPFYQWLKYKEAFSSQLVRYLLELYKPQHKFVCSVLDPFAGVGTTLTTAATMGWKATGIEILPVGIEAMKARLTGYRVDIESYKRYFYRLESISLDKSKSLEGIYCFPHIQITKKAFPKQTEQAISSYIKFLDEIEDSDVRYLFWFACFSILEDVSYTRKDGQYLRWDSRSGRSIKSNFIKGTIYNFKSAIINKLQIMLEDIMLRNEKISDEDVEVIKGSCLSELPKISDNSFDLIITSPPYANRYDYTRTYALELAFLGYNDIEVKKLRQALISCTVENRSKKKELLIEYTNRNQRDSFISAVEVFDKQEALHEVLDILFVAREKHLLNNNNIPNLIKNYHFEMNLVIREFYRVLKPGGTVFMVNDNVSYKGEEIPIDLILSDFAEGAGLVVNNIWFLPRGKGNSSQQMGEHGRTELRKCIYSWSKP